MPYILTDRSGVLNIDRIDDVHNKLMLEESDIVKYVEDQNEIFLKDKKREKQITIKEINHTNNLTLNETLQKDTNSLINANKTILKQDNKELNLNNENEVLNHFRHK